MSCRSAGIASVLLAAPAFAETTECINITSVPYVITAQGVYCLKQNLATTITSGKAIEIQVNNVTIDFNGFKLGGLGGGPSTGAYGVYAQDKRNITLRNGNIRGFQVGIVLDQTSGISSGHLIEDTLFDGITSTAIYIEGSGNVVRNNRIGGTDSTPPAASGFGHNSAAGILGRTASHDGTYVEIFGNTIAEVSGTGVSGISGTFYNSDISDNKVTGITATSHPAYGIYLASSSGVAMRSNTLVSGPGNTTAYGIYTNLGGNYVCLDNLIDKFTIQTSGCTTEVGTVP